MTKSDIQFSEPVISIGTIAEKTGLSVSAIRKYEKEGLIIPHRTESGYRLFSLEDIDRILIIRHMIQEIGLNIEGIRRLQALIPCWKELSCSSKRRKRCRAYKENTKPCWMIKNIDCPKDGNKRRNCPVYRLGFKCVQEIKQIVYNRKDLKLRELINNK
jgi:DNA-binding transcriptional MerR regulator